MTTMHFQRRSRRVRLIQPVVTVRLMLLSAPNNFGLHL